MNIEIEDLLLTSSGRRVEKLSLLIPDVGPWLERRRHLSYGDSPASSPTAPYVQALCVSYNADKENYYSHGPGSFVAGPNTKTYLDFLLYRWHQVNDMQSRRTRMSTQTDQAYMCVIYALIWCILWCYTWICRNRSSRNVRHMSVDVILEKIQFTHISAVELI